MSERDRKDRGDDLKPPQRGDILGEDLSEGPTPATRHPEGGADDIADTTEGPTPDIRAADRRAERAAGEEPHASGQPKADEKTRASKVGTQT